MPLLPPLAPSTQMWEPFRNEAAYSPRLPQAWMRCHSVRSWRSPSFLHVVSAADRVPQGSIRVEVLAGGNRVAGVGVERQSVDRLMVNSPLPPAVRDSLDPIQTRRTAYLARELQPYRGRC